MDNKIKRLPKWAQEYIASLKRQRDIAIRALNESIDQRTPSPFYFDDMISTGEEKGLTIKRFYVQTHQMTIKYHGVKLCILLRQDDKEIDLSWEDENHAASVALIPVSYQKVRLVSKANIR